MLDKHSRYLQAIEAKSLLSPVEQELSLWRPLMIISSIPNRVQILKQKFTNSLGLPFRDLLLESIIREALEAEKISYRRRLFDPFVTLWALLSQVLDTDKSCVNAVSR